MTSEYNIQNNTDYFFENSSQKLDKSIDSNDSDVKYERLFPVFENKSILEKLKIDRDSIHYISTPNNAKKIANIIGSYFKKSCKDITIVDATAGVGGDTIAFSKKFGKVISIEIDNIRYEHLNNNIEVYGFKNVSTINANSNDIIPKLSNIDIIYIDPPWGGSNYKNNTNLKLKMAEIELENLILDYFSPIVMLSQPKMIALKLPKNYDIKYLFNKLNNSDFDNETFIESDKFKIHLHSLNKMIILIIEKT
jgi:16S rRNA G966 N2-methylase RsmD